MSGLLCLKWNNHSSSILRKLNGIFTKEVYCDATIACHGNFYPVHRFVLSTCSEYFEEIFERSQCKHPFIILKDIAQVELEALLNYMYNGEVNVLQETLPGLIKAAESLRIKGLAVQDEPNQVYEIPRDRRRKRSSTSSPVAQTKKSRKRSQESRGDISHIKTADDPEDNIASCQIDDSGSRSNSNPSFDSFSLPNQTSNEVPLKDIKVERFDFNDSSEERMGISEKKDNSDTFPLSDAVNSAAESELSAKEGISFKIEPSFAQCSSWADGGQNDFIPGATEDEAQVNEGTGGDISNYDSFSSSSFNSSTFSNSIQVPQPEGKILNTFVCYKAYDNIIYNKNDCELENAQEKRFQCSSCAYQTDRGYHLKVHMQRRHTLGLPFACSFCEYRCSSKETLRAHCYKHSLTRKKFKCEYCPYESVYSIDVKRHEMNHTGERPFACQLCNFAAIKKDHLKYHINRNHSNIDVMDNKNYF